MNKRHCARLLRGAAENLLKPAPIANYLCNSLEFLYDGDDRNLKALDDLRRQIAIDVKLHNTEDSFGAYFFVFADGVALVGESRMTAAGAAWLATYALMLAEFIKTDT